MDISSFDSAQGGRLWELEEEVFKIIAGEQLTDLWCAIAHNNNWIKTFGFQMLTTTTRNSGEQTTSSQNTLLSHLLAEWALRETGCKKISFHYVEGDDLIIFFYVRPTD